LRLEALEDRCLPSFFAPVSYSVSSIPQDVVTADLRGNGKLDLVIANTFSSSAPAGNSISVLLGNGDGTFQAATNYTVGTQPVSIAVGDFDGRLDANGQPILDLAVANTASNSVSVLLGNGDGTFQPATNYAVGSQPVSLAVGNFDGKLDIVTANQGNDTLNLLPGNGDGTFGLAKSIASLGAPPQSVAVGDFNGDGKLDLAVTTAGTPGTYPGVGGYLYYPGNPSAVTVLLGNGDGTFTTAGSYALGDPLYTGSDSAPSVAVADLNGDGKPDLVATESDQGGYSNSVCVLLNNGNGTFSGPTCFSTGVGIPLSAAVADLNGDHKPDIVTANFNANTVSVFLNNGNGTFGPAENFATGGLSPNAVAAGDFNGDGFPDLAVVNGSNGGSNNVSVLINAADWSTTSQPSSYTVNGFPSPTTAGVSGNFTVTAMDADGSIDTGYTGTVQFTSSDGQAILPSAYTFTAADAGVHTFSATLKTAGTQLITATDTTTASLTGSDDGITVNPAAASTMIVSGFPSPTTAGVAQNFTVTLKDPYGNIASGYRGTVHFTSSDAKAVLPANYTFTATDAGMHTFSSTLKTAGTQLITATDSAAGGLTGTDGGITVKAAAVSKFLISAPATVHAGVAFSLTLTVEDAYGNVVTGYTGTVHFSSTDATASLPKNYTFTTADQGMHTFTGLVLRKKGYQKTTITDTLNSSLTASVIVDVL
jgi:hypothetical protein